MGITIPNKSTKTFAYATSVFITFFILLSTANAEGNKQDYKVNGNDEGRNKEHVIVKRSSKFNKAWGVKKRIENLIDNNKGKRKYMDPIDDADGSHTVFKKNNKGKTTNYQTFDRNKNSKNPNNWTKGNRTDLTGKRHFNKKTNEWVDTPHTHDKNTPGGVRPAKPDEIPKN
ncbi:MAG: hypothetical protein ABW066_16480 [Sedimenticola sp.]